MTGTADVETILDWLAAKRRHVVAALDGLDEVDLRRGALPSGWSMLGLVQHLALDVERFWFRAVLAGHQVDLPTGDAGWQVDPDVPAADVIALYQQETAAADAAVRAVGGLGTEPRWWPGEWGTPPYATAHEVLLHVLVETAAHAGHLDAARELVDGHQHLVISG